MPEARSYAQSQDGLSVSRVCSKAGFQMLLCQPYLRASAIKSRVKNSLSAHPLWMRAICSRPPYQAATQIPLTASLSAHPSQKPKRTRYLFFRVRQPAPDVRRSLRHGGQALPASQRSSLYSRVVFLLSTTTVPLNRLIWFQTAVRNFISNGSRESPLAITNRASDENYAVMVTQRTVRALIV